MFTRQIRQCGSFEYQWISPRQVPVTRESLYVCARGFPNYTRRRGSPKIISNTLPIVKTTSRGWTIARSGHLLIRLYPRFSSRPIRVEGHGTIESAICDWRAKLPSRQSRLLAMRLPAVLPCSVLTVATTDTVGPR